jgi:hypothetical protein
MRFHYRRRKEGAMGLLTKLLIATSPKIPKAGNLGPGQG